MFKIITSVCLSLLLANCAQSFVLSEKCYWNNYCPYNYYATKTMYNVIRGDIRDSRLEDFEGCTPVALWSLNRHGTRRAGDSDTEAMRKVSSLQQPILSSYHAGRSRLCRQDVENLRAWALYPDLDDTINYLTDTGYEELVGIGRRLKDKYPELLSVYDASTCYFRSTTEQRTTMSSYAFVVGLFGDHTSATIDTPRDRDDVIRPYEHCNKWQQKVKDNPKQFVQLNAYYKSKEFKKVAEGIQQRTGIDNKLTPENVTAIFDLCRFEMAWHPKEGSPWCALFTVQDIQILEYADDLRHYYRNGYGSEVNAKLGATAVKDLYETFENVTTQQKPRVVAYFTHDTMMEMVFSAIGLFDDGEPLMANQRRPDRKWRTTFVSPFAVNMLASLYRCAEGEHRVTFHVNEKSVSVCAGAAHRSRSWCSWDQFRHKFQPFLYTDLTFCDI